MLVGGGTTVVERLATALELVPLLDKMIVVLVGGARLLLEGIGLLLDGATLLLVLLVNGGGATVSRLCECRDAIDACWALPSKVESEIGTFDVGATGAELERLVKSDTLLVAAACDETAELVGLASAGAAASVATVQSEGDCPAVTTYSSPSGV